MRSFEWQVWTGGYTTLLGVRGEERWIPDGGSLLRLVGPEQEPVGDRGWKVYHPSEEKGLLRRFVNVKTRHDLERFVSKFGLLNAPTVEDPRVALEQAASMRRVLRLWTFLGSGMPEVLERRIRTVETEVSPESAEGDGEIYRFRRYRVPTGPKDLFEDIPVHDEGGALASVRAEVCHCVTEALAWVASPGLRVENTRFELDFMPRNLAGYLWLLVAHQVAEHRERKACNGCRKDFWLPIGRRSDLEYCSPACRQKAKRARRSRRHETPVPAPSGPASSC